MEKEQGNLSLLEKLSFLMLTDTRARWAGILLVILVSWVTGSLELLGDSSIADTGVAMSIIMILTALIFFGYYAFARSSAPTLRAPNLKKTIQAGSAICGLAVIFSFSSVLFQERVLNQEFAQALNANDLPRIAAVTSQAENVTARFHKTLVARSEPKFIEATQRPSTWRGVLVYLGTIAAPIPVGRTLDLKQSGVSIAIPWGGSLEGGNIEFPELGFDGFISDRYDSSKSPPALINMLVMGGQQTLDGFEWRNVTFVGTRISYKGGMVKLEGVRFVNCTFDLPPNTRGAKLAQYVALALPTLNFGATTS
jgi:hypothetical protein